MSPSIPTEQRVEDVAIVCFGAIGAATKRGVEIDDAGERGAGPEPRGDGFCDALAENGSASGHAERYVAAGGTVDGEPGLRAAHGVRNAHAFRAAGRRALAAFTARRGG